jgi:hypothetical protein
MNKHLIRLHELAAQLRVDQLLLLLLLQRLLAVARQVEGGLLLAGVDCSLNRNHEGANFNSVANFFSAYLVLGFWERFRQHYIYAILNSLLKHCLLVNVTISKTAIERIPVMTSLLVVLDAKCTLHMGLMIQFFMYIQQIRAKKTRIVQIFQKI